VCCEYNRGCGGLCQDSERGCCPCTKESPCVCTKGVCFAALWLLFGLSRPIEQDRLWVGSSHSVLSFLWGLGAQP